MNCSKLQYFNIEDKEMLKAISKIMNFDIDKVIEIYLTTANEKDTVKIIDIYQNNGISLEFMLSGYRSCIAGSKLKDLLIKLKRPNIFIRIKNKLKSWT